MLAVILTIGHNIGTAEKHTTAYIAKTASDILAVEALTAIPCVGYYKGQQEKSTRLEICDIDTSTAERILEQVPALSKSLGQECIMVEQTQTNVRFL